MTRASGKIIAMAVGILLVVGSWSARVANASVPWPLYDVPRMEAVVSDGILVAAEDHGDHSVELLASAEQVLKEAGTRPIELSDG